MLKIIFILFKHDILSDATEKKLATPIRKKLVFIMHFVLQIKYELYKIRKHLYNSNFNGNSYLG